MDNFLELEEKNFDIYMKKINNRVNINTSQFELTILESSRDNSVIMEAKKTLKDKVSELLQKVLMAIAKFISDVKIQLTVKFNQMKLNKKFSELKNVMARTKSNRVNGYVDRLDVIKYKQHYRKFINSYISEVKTGLNKNFSSEEEFDRWKNKMQDKMSEFQYTLTDEERWKLSTVVDDAISITEKNLRSRNGDLDEIQKDGEKALKEIHKSLKGNDISKSVANYTEVDTKVHKKKQGFIGFVFTQIGTCIKTIVKFVSKHLFLTVTALLLFIVTC